MRKNQHPVSPEDITLDSGAASWEDAMAGTIAEQITLAFWRDVARRGASPESDLLDQIPRLARQAVDRFGGAEDDEATVAKITDLARRILVVRDAEPMGDYDNWPWAAPENLAPREPRPGEAEVLQLDGWYTPTSDGDPVVDPNGDGYGITAGTDIDHWRCGPSRLVRVQVRKDADRDAAAKLLRDLADWLGDPKRAPWGLFDPWTPTVRPDLRIVQ